MTQDFPLYFAIVSRVRLDVAVMGSDGGVISSKVVPQVQAVFPSGALSKNTKIALQVCDCTKNFRLQASVIVTSDLNIQKYSLCILRSKATLCDFFKILPSHDSSQRLLTLRTNVTAF